MLFYSKLVSDEFYFVKKKNMCRPTKKESQKCRDIIVIMLVNQMAMMAVKSVSLIFSWEITEHVEAVIADFSGFLTHII